MLTGNDVTGLPVVTFDTGETIDEVKEVVFDPERNKVLAILLNEHGWLKEAQVIPFSGIKSIGPDVVIVDSDEATVGVESDPDLARAVRNDRIVRGARAFTESGQDLGEIRDVVFDERTGRIDGYVMAGGIFAEKFRNKPFMPAPETIRIGKRVVYVPDETATKMEQEASKGGGLTGSLKPSSGLSRDELHSRLANVRKELQEKHVLGRPSQYEVRDSAGNLLVARGERITQEIADRAYQEGLLGQLLLDVEMEELVGLGGTEGAETPGPGTAEDILGQRVSRSVVDGRGNVILEAGQVANPESVDRAREAGRLDELRGAVYAGLYEDGESTFLQ